MRVSVIIPLYNKAPYIRRALDSIRSQTFAEYEVIVVDDGSTDGGQDAVLELDDPRFRLISQENAGPGAARNRGLGEASGEFVAFLDADDEWLPEFLQRSLDLLDRPGSSAATVVSGYYEHPSGKSMEPFWRGRHLVDGPIRLAPSTTPRFAVHLLAYMCPWSTLTRTEVLARWGGFYDKGRCLYGEDAYLFLKILLNHEVIVNLEPLVRFHREASGLSGTALKPRPVEPLLSDPEGLRAACPPDLRELLEAILTLRALKTACVLGYWGRTREARDLLVQHRQLASRWPLRRLFARIWSGPLGPPLGALYRSLIARLT